MGRSDGNVKFEFRNHGPTSGHFVSLVKTWRNMSSLGGGPMKVNFRSMSSVAKSRIMMDPGFLEFFDYGPSLSFTFRGWGFSRFQGIRV